VTRRPAHLEPPTVPLWRRVLFWASVLALVLASLAAHAATGDGATAEQTVPLVGGGAAGGAALLYVAQQAVALWKKRDGEERTERQVKRAAEKSAAEATRAAALADLRSDLVRLEAQVATKASAADLERVERLQTAEAAAGAAFREGMARDMGVMQGAVQAATAAALAGQRTTD
jgi:hypothetical protein